MARLLGRAASGAVAGAACWFTAGALALDTSIGPARTFGLLPPALMLALLVVSGALGAVAFARPSTLVLSATALLIVPWLSPVPAAVLMWSGPLSLIVWAIVVVNAVGPLFAERRGDSRALVALATAAVATLVQGAGDPRRLTGDEPHYLLVASSLIADGDLDLANDYDLATYRGFYPGSLEPRHTILVPSGHQYSFHGLGPSLMALPGFRIGGIVGARLVMALFVVIGLTLSWDALRLATSSTGAAWAGWAAVTLSIPLAAQIAAIYPDGPAASIAGLALWTLVRIERRERVDRLVLFVTGLALSMLPWLHIRLALVAFIFGLALAIALWRQEADRGSLVALFAAPLIGAVLWLGSFAVLFETLDPTAPFRTKAAGSLAALPAGVFGLLLDHEYGLLVYSPGLLFAVGGFRALRRALPCTAWCALAVIVSTLAVGASYVWWGGFTTPARFLVPVLPVMALFVAAWWAGATRSSRAVCGALVLLGASLLAIGAFVEGGILLVGAPDGRLTVFERANQIVDLPASLPSLFRAGITLAGEASIVVAWLGAAVVVLACAWPALGQSGKDSFPIAGIGLLAWLSLGVTGGWWLRGVPAETLDRGQLSVLHAAATPWLTTGIAWPSLLPKGELVTRLSVASRGEDSEIPLHVPRVPAGRYRIEVEDGAPARASLTLEAGRDAWPLFAWDAQNRAGAPEFALAVPVHSVAVRTSLPDRTGRIALHVLEIFDDADSSSVAERVTRYGRWLVYSLDRLTYMETGGFWCAADRTTRIVVADLAGRGGEYALQLEAGPAPIAVRIGSNGTVRSLNLSPGGKGRVEMPADASVAPVSIAIDGGFKAADAFANRDGRRLGVWISIDDPRF